MASCRLLGGAWVAAMAAATRNAEIVAIPYETPISPLISAGIVTTGFMVFVALCLRPDWFRLGGRRAMLLGALTYPLYLLHQKLGYLVINAVEPIGGRWIALASPSLQRCSWRTSSIAWSNGDTTHGSGGGSNRRSVFSIDWRTLRGAWDSVSAAGCRRRPSSHGGVMH